MQPIELQPIKLDNIVAVDVPLDVKHKYVDLRVDNFLTCWVPSTIDLSKGNKPLQMVGNKYTSSSCRGISGNCCESASWERDMWLVTKCS